MGPFAQRSALPKTLRGKAAVKPASFLEALPVAISLQSADAIRVRLLYPPMLGMTETAARNDSIS